MASRFYRPNRSFVQLQHGDGDMQNALRCCKELLVYLSHQNKVDHMRDIMDDIFKACYRNAVITNISLIVKDWRQQVNQLNEHWSEARRRIDRNVFLDLFYTECNDSCLPGDTYDVVAALHKAEDEWLGELMVQAAEDILRSGDRAIPSTVAVVGWNSAKRRIVIDQTECSKIMRYDECDCDLR